MVNRCFVNCDICDYWRKKRRPPERLWWLGWIFNVEQSKQMSGGIETEWFLTTDLAALVRWPQVPSEDGGCRFDMRRAVDQNHLAHVDVDQPVILATPTKGLETVFPSGVLMLLDGAHRVARAMNMGVSVLEAFVLSESQTGRVMRRWRRGIT